MHCSVLTLLTFTAVSSQPTAAEPSQPTAAEPSQPTEKKPAKITINETTAGTNHTLTTEIALHA